MPRQTENSLLKPQSKDEKERLTINISSGRVNELRRYAQFLNDSDISYVVDQSLAYLFSHDKAYAQWLKSNPGDEPARRSPSHE